MAESCESDETEVEEVKPLRANLGLPDPLIEEKKIPGSRSGCLIDVTAKAESRPRPRYQQIKVSRPFQRIVSVKVSDELSDQKRFSILSWNAGPKRGNVANSVVGCYHVILVQEAESHYREIVTSAGQQFHVYQGADQLIFCNKSTFEPEGVRIPEEISGTSKHDSLGLRYLLVRSRFRRPPKEGSSTNTAVSADLGNRSAFTLSWNGNKERQSCKQHGGNSPRDSGARGRVALVAPTTRLPGRRPAHLLQQKHL